MMQEQNTPQEPLAAGEHIDPVCGMVVEEGPGAITYDYKGTTYYFCSDAHKADFDTAPEKWLD